MAFKGTIGRPLFEPDPINNFSIGRCETLQFVYCDIPFESVSQIEPQRFLRSLRQFDLLLFAQKNFQLRGLDISFAGLRRVSSEDLLDLGRRFWVRAIAI